MALASKQGIPLGTYTTHHYWVSTVKTQTFTILCRRKGHLSIALCFTILCSPMALSAFILLIQKGIAGFNSIQKKNIYFQFTLSKSSWWYTTSWIACRLKLSSTFVNGQTVKWTKATTIINNNNGNDRPLELLFWAILCTKFVYVHLSRPEVKRTYINNMARGVETEKERTWTGWLIQKETTTILNKEK